VCKHEKKVLQSGVTFHCTFSEDKGLNACHTVPETAGHHIISEITIKTVWWARRHSGNLLIVGQDTNGIVIALTIWRNYTLMVGGPRPLK